MKRREFMMRLCEQPFLIPARSAPSLHLPAASMTSEVQQSLRAFFRVELGQFYFHADLNEQDSGFMMFRVDEGFKLVGVGIEMNKMRFTKMTSARSVAEYTRETKAWNFILDSEKQ